MAWPASQQVLADALVDVHRQMTQIKSVAVGEVANLSSDTNADKIIKIYQRMTIFDKALARAAAVSGIVAYTKDQFNDQNFNVVAEFSAIRILLQVVTTQIETDLPAVGSFLQTHSFVAGEYTARTFTAAQTANLRLTLTNLSNAIS